MKTYTNLEELYNELIKSECSNGKRFAIDFANFISTVNHNIVVETGSGVSTLFLLRILKNFKLYSVDLEPWTCRIEYPNYKFIEGIKTEDCLYDLFVETGPWDVFLHDSDHEVRCMTYELELAYGYVKPGGIIACDDIVWDTQFAWNRFINKYNLTYTKIGSLGIIKKPLDVLVVSDPFEHWKNCIQLGIQAEIERNKIV